MLCEMRWDYEKIELLIFYDSYSYIQLKPNDILILHKYLYSYSESNNGGRYKMVDNYIEEDAIHHINIDPLLIIPCVILDFLCIHSFGDGNGRMSRLLTLLLLYKAEYLVGKYISVEMVVEKSKETYYEVLQDSSSGWNENTNDYMPFIKYTLGTIINAYKDFEERLV